MESTTKRSNFAPEGWHTITPRIVVHDANAFVGFLHHVFDATGEYQQGRPSQIWIGDSLVMITDVGIRESAPAFLYVYVSDADATYLRAIGAGANPFEEPSDTPYGDRRCTVEDKWGNTWQIATQLGDRGADKSAASRLGLIPAPGAYMVTRLASCSCGQLTAQVAGEPVRISICHCLACQRRTGSVFGEQARFPRENVSISGASTEYVRVGDEGSRARFHFCPKCGSTVYYEPEELEAFLAIPVGAFADPNFPSPLVSVYESRMHQWVVPPPGAEHIP